MCAKTKQLCPASLYPGFTFIADSDGHIFHLNGNLWRQRCKKNFKRKPNCHSSYMIVSKGSQSFLVSRIVCAAFHGAPKQGQQCHHLNGHIYDNRPDNLIWLSRSRHRHYDARLKALKALLGNQGVLIFTRQDFIRFARMSEANFQSILKSLSLCKLKI